MSLIHKVYKDNLCEVRHMVDEAHDNMRLDQYVAQYLESFSREQIKKKIKDKDIFIIDRPGNNKPSTPVHYRDHIIIHFHRTIYEDEYWEGKKIILKEDPDIVYEDNDLLVISKPPFMSTHPSGRHLFNCATVVLEMKYGHTIHPLHRIDRETSGILMLGKNPKMAVEMMENFEDDDVKKCYLFIGKINDDFKGLDYFEANERMSPPPDERFRLGMEVFPEYSHLGKHAKTFFYILERTDKYVIGMACPQTGRQHQIRVHAMVHGMPLVGDKLYLGGYEMFKRFKDLLATQEEHDLMEIPRHALHAIALKIPYRKDNKLFITKIPHDLAEWITKNTSFKVEDIEKKIQLTSERYYNSRK